MSQARELEHFPGRVFNGDGVSIDHVRGDLTLARLERLPYRAVVTSHNPLNIGLIWVLRSSARYEAVPQDMISAATWRMTYSNEAVLILGPDRRPVDDFRYGLMLALLAAEDADTNAAVVVSEYR